VGVGAVSTMVESKRFVVLGEGVVLDFPGFLLIAADGFDFL
jgi:hypothetical protein